MKRKEGSKDQNVLAKKKKSFSPQRGTKQKFEKKNSPNKKSFKSIDPSTVKKSKNKELSPSMSSMITKQKALDNKKIRNKVKGDLSKMKFQKKTSLGNGKLKKEKEDIPLELSSSKSSIVTEQKSPGKQKIKSKIKEDLSKKKLQKKIKLVNGKLKKEKKEFPLELSPSMSSVITKQNAPDNKKVRNKVKGDLSKMKFQKKTSLGNGKLKKEKEDIPLELSSSKSSVVTEQKSPGKEKIKNKIQEDLLKKKLQKKIKLVNGKLKKEKKEFPLDKNGKPQWDKVKSEKKKLKETRKVHRTGEEQYQLSVRAKGIWEKLRRKKISEDKKEALVNELFMLLKGQIPNVVYCHDMARVVEWMLKLGSPAVRSSICEALSSNTVAYIQSKYASFCIRRALKYCTKADRNSLIQSCYGHFFKLFSHLLASPVVELMYAVYASAEQRRQIQREMYGEMHALVASDITSIQNIPDNMRPAILAATKANLTKLLTKKELFKHTLLQWTLHDFLASCSENDRSDILGLIQGDVVEFLNTKEGSRVALQVVWHGTNKVKKLIVKALKGKVRETACSEVGHIFLLALFDCVDDTVLVKKALIPEVLSEAVELVKNEWGRKVILYLVAHRDPAYFHPHQVQILAKGDTIGTRKKDNKVREQEMLEAVSGPLLQQIAAAPATWLGDSSVAMVSLAVMKSGKGEALKEVFEKMVDYMLDPESSVEINDRKFHVIEDSALHLVFKKLIHQHTQQIESDKTQETFPKVLASRLTEKHINFLIQFNRGCFLLVLLFELKCKNINKVLKKKITESVKKSLQNQETTGSKVLLKKLSEV